MALHKCSDTAPFRDLSIPNLFVDMEIFGFELFA